MYVCMATNMKRPNSTEEAKQESQQQEGLLLSSYAEGDLVGVEALRKSRRVATVTATTPVTLVAISHEALKKVWTYACMYVCMYACIRIGRVICDSICMTKILARYVSCDVVRVTSRSVRSNAVRVYDKIRVVRHNIYTL
jgi:CRP-like cAMP-binding protein